MEENRHNEADIRTHYQLLRHVGCGVTELRTFKPVPQVAYTDNEQDFVCCCAAMDGADVYVGVQPRPPQFLEMANNRWIPAVGGPLGNCAKDLDIEYISALFFDIDVNTPEKNAGYPASEQELQQVIEAARQMAQLAELKEAAVMAVSGNGAYVIVPIVPIAVYDERVGRQFKAFCEGLVCQVAADIPSGVRIDPVFNLSRVMRVIGTVNHKGAELPDRPYRRSYFLDHPQVNPSYAVHQQIGQTEVADAAAVKTTLGAGLRCNLKRLEKCEFIQWCRRHPTQVSEPHWFGLISNLMRLEGGVALIHELSSLDPQRYDAEHTQRIIERLQACGYKPVSCKNLTGMQISGRSWFSCSRLGCCEAACPMYVAACRII